MLNIKPFAPLTSLTSCCTNFVDLFHTNHTTADHTVHLITLELQHSYHKPRSFHSLRLHHCHQPPTTTTHLNALRVTPSSTLNHSHLPLFLFPSYTVLIKAGCKITCVCVCVCVSKLSTDSHILWNFNWPMKWLSNVPHHFFTLSIFSLF